MASAVRLYVDPISPYSYLAFETIAAAKAECEIEWEIHPVVYAKLLEAHGLVGPVESDAKRRYTMLDLVRCAERQGLKVTGPPTHPFRSLSALRVIALFEGAERQFELTRTLLREAWENGRDLEDWQVLESAVHSTGLDATELESHATDAKIKQRLIDSTTSAIERGVFGVPSFEFEGELFWGNDRLHQLFERVNGSFPAPDAATVSKILERPIGVRRSR